MSNSLLQTDLAELAQLASSNCDGRGVHIVSAGEAACKLLRLWLNYLEGIQTTGTADCLLTGAASAAREGLACVALGLVRPALNSLRLEIDLSLAWLYFKDHLVEWRRVQETGDGFKAKAEALKYLADSVKGYQARFGILRDCRTRKVDDPYRLLSAHIHGQNEAVLPQVQKPKDIIASAQAQEEFVQLQFECSEYINDIFWSVFANRWASLPNPLMTDLVSRFKSPDQRVSFFA